MVKSPIDIAILAFADSAPIVPIGVADLLRKSDELAQSLPGAGKRPKLSVQLISATRTKSLVAAGGLPIQCADTVSSEARAPRLVVVPALDPDIGVQLEKNALAIPWLISAYRAGADLASVCTGAFALGETGLLDGRHATTHWAFQSAFQARYPKVRLAPEAIIVDTGRIITSGGATSFVNLTLLLVERFLGADVARTASRMFLIDVNKSPQGAYAIFGTQKRHDDDAVHRAQAIIESAPSALPSVDELARATAMSTRTFVRRFQRATGNGPREYAQRVRIEAAKRELERGERSIQDVARTVGYGDPVAFRKMFLRLTGLTPSEYRERYGPRSTPGYVARKVNNPGRAPTGRGEMPSPRASSPRRGSA